MIMISFRTKKDKEHLLEKAIKMEEYASMIVDCLEHSEYDEYEERDGMNYRHHDEEEMMDMNDRMAGGRYGYRRMGRRMK